MIQRRNLILLVAGLALALMAILVLAAHSASNTIDPPALNSPSTRQNVSNVSGGYLLLNASFDPAYNQSLIINVTFHFQNNNTGYFVLNTTVQNTSVNQTIFQNLTFLSTLLADGKYNITVTARNGTVLTNNSFIINSTTAINITIDNTPPNTTFNFLNSGNNDVNGSNYSLTAIVSNKTFNASAFDLTTDVANVYFWFDNGTSTDVNVSGINNSGQWVASYNLSLLIEGKQGVRVVANDSVSNRNHTAMINFTLDFSAPNVSKVTTNGNPDNGSNFSVRSSNQTFNFTIFDSFTGVQSVYFWFDNGTGNDFNVTATNQSGEWVVNSVNVSNLVEGRQGLRVRANDTVGNINNTELNFTMDFTTPNVSIVTLNGNPNNASNFSVRSSNQTFNFTISDNLTRVENVYFWFDNGTGNDFNVTATNQSGEWVVNSVNVSNLVEGRQGIRVRANDTVGNVNNTAFNFTIDFTTPNVSVLTLNARNVQNRSNFSDNRNITFNFTIVDNLTEVSNVYLWFDNGTGNDFNVTAINVSGEWYVSYNVSAFMAESQGVRIRANDTVGNINNSLLNFTVDRTIPSVSPSVSSIGTTSATLTATVNDTGAANCSFTGSAAGSGSLISGTAISGTGAMTSFTSTLETEPSLTYSVTVTCRDHAGNSGSGTTSFTSAATASTSNGGGGSGGSSGGISAGVQGQTAKEVWSSINAGETAKVEVKNGAIGVTEVSFSVPATVYGAWVQVAKKDSLPSSVSSFSGKVYRNLEISKGPALNKEGSFADATVQFKVEKAWLAEKQLTKEAVALHRYVDGKWNELSTSVGEDDGTYVHYSAKTPGFSYFVIGEKSGAAAAAPEAEAAPVEASAEQPVAEAPAEEPAMEKKGLSKGLLVALLVAAVVVVAVVLYMRKKR